MERTTMPADGRAVVLTAEEAQALTRLTGELADGTALESPLWMNRARTASCALPTRIGAALRRFRHDAGEDGVLLVKGLPLGPLPPTPGRYDSLQMYATQPAALLVSLALCIGEPVGFADEKGGSLVHDVVPVPGMADFPGNAGSAPLTLHVENAFHPHRPDVVGLLCLRNDHDDAAALRTASGRRAVRLLDSGTVDVLREPRFVTEAPASFGSGETAAEPHAVLYGSVEDPSVRVDFTSTHATDGAAAGALAELSWALEEVRTDLVLAPGDLALVDNRVALHGRSRFAPRHDGTDRWLHRVFVHVDFRASRAWRPRGGHVISGQAVS
ncbi:MULTISPECIES: TauD/TfdA family dioxygenase [unclassified Amycolatopsis]|uniref:TauD/TfdA family dioxygenase n=1 Tax=unclassified Amycolatopsis TaxID=2618356 RepID=UPI00106E5F1C|nr:MULTISPECIES: TauD/TfdA family dioxygenase [unclassified Amycolatopsis]